MSPFPNNWPPALSRNPELIQKVGEGGERRGDQGSKSRGEGVTRLRDTQIF